MSKDLAPPSSGVAEDQPATTEPRRLRVAALLNTSALLCTTALLTAVEPKNPPYRGD